MKAYKVYNCAITGGTIWSGTVIAKDDETVSDALKRKFDLKYLYCEKYGKEVKADDINPDSIFVENLTVGELMIILGSR
jgi:hypothetical protein